MTISEQGKIATSVLLVIAMVAVAGFSAYVLFTTENTVIVINEAAKPKEEFVAGTDTPSIPEPEPEPNSRIEILETGVGFLNVRASGSIQAAKVGQVKPGEVYEYTAVENDWYKISHPELEKAWVSGQYVKKVDRSQDLFGGD